MIRTLIYVFLIALSTPLSSQNYYEKQLLSELCKFSDLMSIYFDEYDIPEKYKVIPIVESGLSLNAKSGVGAVGPWQITPIVAKMYEISYDDELDERMCILKSTEVACQYLRYLHDKFKDWNYVLIAWNWGEGNVFKLMKEGLSYREILEESPRETKQFVSKVKRYSKLFLNFECPDDYKYDKFLIKGYITIDRILECTNLDSTLVYELNPLYDGYKRDTFVILPDNICYFCIF